MGVLKYDEIFVQGLGTFPAVPKDAITTSIPAFTEDRSPFWLETSANKNLVALERRNTSAADKLRFMFHHHSSVGGVVTGRAA